MIVSPFLEQVRTVIQLKHLSVLFYKLGTGCRWRMLPAAFPQWPPVYYYWMKWGRMTPFGLQE